MTSSCWTTRSRRRLSGFPVEHHELSAGRRLAAANARPRARHEVRSHLAGSWRVAYLFDDFNSTPNDLDKCPQGREPGDRLAGSGSAPGGIHPIGSGQRRTSPTIRSFCGRLWRTVTAKAARSIGPGDCPPIDYYMADQIINNRDGGHLKWSGRRSPACQFEGTDQFL